MDATVISNDTNYWLIRPGIENLCYNMFKRDNVVAIGWDRISTVSGEANESTLDRIKDIVRREYSDLLSEIKNDQIRKRKVSDIASKIFRFNFQLKENDIVLCPGDHSVLIGRITGAVYIDDNRYCSRENQEKDEYIGALNKVRKVVWLKELKREEIEPNIQLELRVAHGLSMIVREQVITEINRSVFPMYSYNNESHSIFRITNSEAIDFEKYASFIRCVDEVYKRYKEDDEEFYIKANFNSPGPIELIGRSDKVFFVSKIVTMILKKNVSDVISDYEWVSSKQDDHPEDFSDYDFPDFTSGGQV